MKRSARVMVLVLSLSIICALSACSGKAATSTTRAPRSNAGPNIVINGFKYTVPAAVKAGEKITVRNEDNVAHTVTATSGHAFDVKIAGGASATLTAPAQPGSYKFICTYHPYMHATLVVTS